MRPSPSAPQKAKRADVEGPIHRAILQYLALAMPGAMIHHSPNGITIDQSTPDIARAVKRALSKAAWNGTRPGWPDIEVGWRGEMLFFEVKSPTGTISAEQVEVLAGLRRQGFKCAVVRSVSDAQAHLTSWGLPIRKITGIL